MPNEISVQPYKTILPLRDMEHLRLIFPDPYKVDDLNFALFSTGGIGGTYVRIEDVKLSLGECDEPDSPFYVEPRLTILVVKPRIVCLHHGHIEVTLDDVPYLKALRESSRRAVGFYFGGDN